MNRRERLLDLRSGGWLVLLAVALVLFLAVWMLMPVLRSTSTAVGDGRNVESYGFDLSAFDLPRGTLAASGFPKNGVPTLNAPATMPGSRVAAFNEERRGKYLVSDDRVIGLVVNGEARAYPVRVMNWHEVANDTLGGVPVAVTYHPLCDSAVVFDRRLDGEVLEFGVSGLLHNSNLLMFDRREDAAAESLWSQLRGRAVSGPSTGARLRVLPSSLAHWNQWLEHHPDTTVVEPDEKLLKRYQRNPYGNYRMTGEPRFPVDPLPPREQRGWMSSVVAVEETGGAGTRLYPLDECAIEDGAETVCDDAGLLLVEGGERSYGVRVDADAAEGGPGVYHALWFAWYAARGSRLGPELPANHD